MNNRKKNNDLQRYLSMGGFNDWVVGIDEKSFKLYLRPIKQKSAKRKLS